LEVLKTEAPSTLAAMSAANYFTAVDSQQSSLLQQGEEDITTLVPEEPGSYQDKMRLGERLFRQGEYREASREFELANVISLNAPETHLSLMHVHFAGADRNYSLPAYYLRQALRYLPELPLVRVHPKSFYGQTATYIRDLVDLEDYVKADPFDYDSRLMLAYLQWRDGQTTESVENLSYALALAVNEEQIEAVDTLWDGMTASGKTSGVLAPAELPQPESEEESADPTANPSPDEADEIPAPAPSEGE
jgi:tetratricopeptide (TPR) repeat protein